MAMDHHWRSGNADGNVVGKGVDENWGVVSLNQAVLATEDGMCNKETSAQTNSMPYHKRRPFQFEVGSKPPKRRGKNSLLVDLAASDRSEAIGKMLYKTKLCSKFRAGVCPFIKNCNFAHSKEEIRKPPPNWQEIVAAHKEERAESSEPREVFQIPVMCFNEVTQGLNVRPHCRNFLSEVGCQYGEKCNFVHDEHHRDRISAAICLLPGTEETNRSKSTLNPANWKTRMCKKWESTGFCVYGSNCHFAHGFAELQCHGGWLVNIEAKDSSTFDTNQVAVPAKASLGTVDAPITSVPYSYRIGVPSRTLPNVIQKTGEIPARKWKWPNKISKIYGDWIDDL